MKGNDFILISDRAFLYSTWSGVLKVTTGKVLQVKRFESIGTFCSENDEKIVTCHLEPEKIYNAMVWLPERNDEKAINCIMKYHEKEIEKLKNKIENHLNKMVTVKGGVQNENN